MLVFRCFALSFCVWLFFARPEEFTVIGKGGFFHHFSLLHVLFIVWILDMLIQLLPVRNIVPLGSQKHLKIRFMEIKDKIKSVINVGVNPKAVDIGDLPRSEKKTTRVFDYRY
jgi:hypothetical protein